MKKKSIKKLKLQKASISTLNMSVVKGGNDQNSVFPCLSVNFSCFSVNYCETINYTRCYGANECLFYVEGPSIYDIC